MGTDFGGGLGFSSEEHADVSICIFPHLQDFIVIDIRDELPGRPQVRLLKTNAVLKEEFYTEVESSFSQLLREQEQPFANLLALPDHLEALVRESALKAILEMINADVPDAELPQIAILLFTGPALYMNSTQLTDAIQRLFERELDSSIITECVEMVEKLLAQEKKIFQTQEEERLREMIKGQSSEYFTLWENTG